MQKFWSRKNGKLADSHSHLRGSAADQHSICDIGDRIDRSSSVYRRLHFDDTSYTSDSLYIAMHIRLLVAPFALTSWDTLDELQNRGDSQDKLLKLFSFSKWWFKS